MIKKFPSHRISRAAQTVLTAKTTNKPKRIELTLDEIVVNDPDPFIGSNEDGSFFYKGKCWMPVRSRARPQRYFQMGKVTGGSR